MFLTLLSILEINISSYRGIFDHKNSNKIVKKRSTLQLFNTHARSKRPGSKFCAPKEAHKIGFPVVHEDKMAAENDESWVVILPEVFNLLLTKPDKVVDDTSIEKLLAWISDVCGTSSGREKILTHVLSFLSSAEIFHSCTTLSFALRVCGIIWCKDSGSFKENPSWIELFAKARDVLWQEAVVRDAYFTGLTSLAMFDEGLQWMQENRGMYYRDFNS